MTRTALKQLLSRQRDTRQLLEQITSALGTEIAVEDVDGAILHGAALSNGAIRHAVTHEGAEIGWVSGSPESASVAAVLNHLVTKDVERKALGAEVLHLYREVNLIYSFSEKLAALLDLDRVATLTLQEARHLIPASDGAVMLLDETTGDLSMLAAFGERLPAITGFRKGVGVIGSIAASGLADIVNDVEADPRRIRDGTGIKSLIGAPLKVGERVIGVIALGSVELSAYTAAELKLLNTLALQTATAIENARLFERTVQAALERERLLALHQQAELARAKLEREFELAARIQMDLFPATLPAISGYALAARNRPARQCGGDYYDAIPLTGPDGRSRVVICVADVSGKGLPAALLMSNMQATLRALFGRSPSLVDLAWHANDLLYASTSPNRYVTAALLEFEPQTGIARYVSAGHADCLLLKKDGSVVRLESTGTPLGLLPPGLPYDERHVRLDNGDCVVLFSDGVPDAQNAAGQEFGDGRLLDVLQASAGEAADGVVDRVFDAIDRFAGAEPQFDDITMLVLQRLDAPAA